MKKVLEKVRKNKLHQQKAPKGWPVGDVNYEDGAMWLAHERIKCQCRYRTTPEREVLYQLTDVT